MERKVSKNPRVASQIELLKMIEKGDEKAYQEMKRRLKLLEENERRDAKGQDGSNKV